MRGTLIGESRRAAQDSKSVTHDPCATALLYRSRRELHFFDLPREVRDKIYFYIYQGTKINPLYYRGRLDFCSLHGEPYLAYDLEETTINGLLTTSKRTREEALPVFWDNVLVTVVNCALYDWDDNEHDLSLPLWRSLRNSVKRIAFYSDEGSDPPHAELSELFEPVELNRTFGCRSVSSLQKLSSISLLVNVRHDDYPEQVTGYMGDEEIASFVEREVMQNRSRGVIAALPGRVVEVTARVTPEDLCEYDREWDVVSAEHFLK